MAFYRRFSDDLIQQIKNQKLFTEYLVPDITETLKGHSKSNSDVFPAIRNNQIDFYHRGGNLFKFGKKGFSTHHKYASVLDVDNDYLTESELGRADFITSFTDKYTRIKENCSKYSGKEAEGVSYLYNKFSCAKKELAGEVVVLDIEVSLENTSDDDRSQDRIDILLFHTHKRMLKFFEAKHFKNGELRAQGSSTPAVINQLERYQAQLNNQKTQERILLQYSNHVSILNELFELHLETPESIDLNPCLYIFGFDNDQKKGQLKKDLTKFNDIPVYFVGDPKNAVAKTLWEKAK